MDSQTVHDPPEADERFSATVAGARTERMPFGSYIALGENEPGLLHIQAGCQLTRDGVGQLVEHLMGWMRQDAERQS